MAALELALMSPVLGMLLLGGYDLSRLIIARAGVDKVGFSVADVTAQYEQLTSATMAKVFMITGSSLPTYVSGTNGVTVLTSVYLDTAANKTKIRWQCYSTTATPWTSKIGSESGLSTVETDLLADGNDNVIVSEVFYRFDPIFKTFFKSGFQVYASSLFRPRLGALTVKPC